MKTFAKSLALGLLSSAILFAPGAFAQSAAPSALVTFEGNVNQPSLRDDKQRDTFTLTLKDARIVSSLEAVCQAGRMNFGLLRQDEACALSGTGSLVNPNNPAQTVARAQYGGGFTITKSGYTDPASLTVSYLQVGNVAGGNTKFGGSVMMTPEVPSNGAMAIFESVSKRLPGDGGDAKLINEAIDSIELSKFFVPSAGLASDGGCSWTGDMIFAYQSDTWYVKLKADCTETVNGAPVQKTYDLSGNMVWTETPGVDAQTQYDVTLTLPSATMASDDAFFSEAAGDDAFFSSVDGIAGSILMAESGYVEVDIDGTKESLPTRIDISGSLQGTNVPLNVVRSFSTIIATFPRTFFGA